MATEHEMDVRQPVGPRRRSASELWRTRRIANLWRKRGRGWAVARVSAGRGDDDAEEAGAGVGADDAADFGDDEAGDHGDSGAEVRG